MDRWCQTVAVPLRTPDRTVVSERLVRSSLSVGLETSQPLTYRSVRRLRRHADSLSTLTDRKMAAHPDHTEILTAAGQWRDQCLITRPDLSGANLYRTNLRGVNLDGADLVEADLRGARLAGAELMGAKLAGARLAEADLTRANLVGADLSEADLSYACLEEVDLSFAKLQGACLYDADLPGADLRHANLEGAILECAHLRDATYNDTTIWPEGFEPEEAGAIKEHH